MHETCQLLVCRTGIWTGGQLQSLALMHRPVLPISLGCRIAITQLFFFLP
jgi:hypothetical protein